MDSESSPVKDFYRGSNVFITGATGFLGMALVEKLLRVIPDIGTIYLLIRPKKGKAASERIEELVNNPVSNSLTIRDVFLNQKRVNVCEDTIKRIKSENHVCGFRFVVIPYI